MALTAAINPALHTRGGKMADTAGRRQLVMALGTESATNYRWLVSVKTEEFFGGCVLKGQKMPKIKMFLLAIVLTATSLSAAFSEDRPVQSPDSNYGIRQWFLEKAHSQSGKVYLAACCKTCRKGKACGDSCISRSYTCRKGVGCACDG
jgi:hypothetical protein